MIEQGHVYDQDFLRSQHNHEFLNSPAFQAAYCAGLKRQVWTISGTGVYTRGYGLLTVRPNCEAISSNAVSRKAS